MTKTYFGEGILFGMLLGVIICVVVAYLPGGIANHPVQQVCDIHYDTMVNWTTDTALSYMKSNGCLSMYATASDGFSPGFERLTCITRHASDAETKVLK